MNNLAKIQKDIKELEDCQKTIKSILDNVGSFSFIALPMGLSNARWELSNAVKIMKSLIPGKELR